MIDNILLLADFFKSAASGPILEGKALYRFKNQLESYYKLDPTYPKRNLDEVKEEIKYIAKDNNLTIEDDINDPNKLLIGLKTFSDLLPPIVKNYFIKIEEVVIEGHATKYLVQLIKDSTHSQKRKSKHISDS